MAVSLNNYFNQLSAGAFLAAVTPKPMNGFDMTLLDLVRKRYGAKQEQANIDPLAVTRQVVDGEERKGAGLVPAYFEDLQAFLAPQEYALRRNGASAMTPKGNSDPMDAARDLCR